MLKFKTSRKPLWIMVMTEYLLEEASITREGPYALRSYGFLDKAKYSHWTITWQVTNWQLGVQHVSFSLSQMDTSEFSHAFDPLLLLGFISIKTDSIFKGSHRHYVYNNFLPLGHMSGQSQSHVWSKCSRCISSRPGWAYGDSS